MKPQDVRKLLDASTDAATAGAHDAMSSDDRNVRFAALRVIQSVANRADLDAAAEAQAVAAVLKGLQDPKRRVRWNAVRCAGSFLDHSKVVERLQSMAENDQETRKIRFKALFVLSDARELPDPALEALKVMNEVPMHRATILLILLRANLTQPVEEMLREFVRSGTRQEAVLATRALCGFKVVHYQALSKEARKTLKPEDRAMSANTWWWVRRDPE